MPETNRAPPRGRVELGGGRQAIELRIVERLATHPRFRWENPRAFADGGHDVGGGAKAVALEIRVPGREREEMQMRIDQPGQDDGAPAVDALGPRADEPAQVTTGPEREDAIAAERDRAGERPPRVERDDAGVLEQPGRRRQSDDGSGFASFTFISWSQHETDPVPALLHRISVPQVSHR